MDFVLILCVPILIVLARLYYVCVYVTGKADRGKSRKPRRLMVILGSGGHTTEALCLLEKLDPTRYHPVTFILAATDTTSAVRATAAWKGSKDEIKFIRIPRSREVHQSWLSTLWTTGYAILYAFPVVFRERPDMILCNGPGTCVPICCVAWLFTFLGLHRTVITFVESICRVKTLSLTGKILYLFTDAFFVQYNSLSERYPRSVFLGRLV